MKHLPLQKTDRPWIITYARWETPQSSSTTVAWGLCSVAGRWECRNGGEWAPGQVVPSSAALTVSLAAKLCLETETVFANNLFNTGSLWEL